MGLTASLFRFHVDLGDSIQMADDLMRSTGNAENGERNQCDPLRLATGIPRNETGREKRAPERGRIFALAQDLGGGGPGIKALLIPRRSSHRWR